MELGKIAGVSLRVHPTFFLMLLLYGVLGLAAQAILVFSLVIGHELAHLLVARAYGFRVLGLEIFPLGGVAYCEGHFEGRKVEESLMALAGPAFNLLLLFIAQDLRWQGWWTGTWAEDFVRYNFWLATFNLIPVLPLDGGRVLRALLSSGFGFVRVTRALAWAGKWLGIGLAVYVFSAWARNGLQESLLFFLLLAGFFWLAGNKEISAAHVTFLQQLTHKKEELVRKGLMRSRWVTVHEETPLVRIVEEFSPDSYALISLTSREFTLDKTLTETEVLEGMLREGIHHPVGRLR
ncbi:MAG: M50 family metallopeptidase [Desulfitobacteriaceae bacterium]